MLDYFSFSGCKISWGRVLEIWRTRDQVLLACNRSVLSNLQGPSLLHVNQPVRVSSDMFFIYLHHKFAFIKHLPIIDHEQCCHFSRFLRKYLNEDVSLGAWFIGLDRCLNTLMILGTQPGIDIFFPSFQLISFLVQIHVWFSHISQLWAVWNI